MIPSKLMNPLIRSKATCSLVASSSEARSERVLSQMNSSQFVSAKLVAHRHHLVMVEAVSCPHGHEDAAAADDDDEQMVWLNKKRARALTVAH